MANGILLSDQEGSSVKPGGAVPNAVGHKNPLPITKDYLTVIEYDVNNNPLYIGQAMPGTAKSATGWKIKKITWDVSGNATDIQFASNTKLFDKIWNNRASYSYG